MINDTSGSHSLFLEQDDRTFTTVHAVLDGSAHDLTGLSATPNGLSVKGKIKIFIWNDDFALMVAPGGPNGQSTVTIIISGYKTFSGVLSADQSAALVAFLVAAKLPELAE